MHVLLQIEGFVNRKHKTIQRDVPIKQLRNHHSLAKPFHKKREIKRKKWHDKRRRSLESLVSTEH